MTSRTGNLEVDHLAVGYTKGLDTIHAVNDVSFRIGRGERVALIGESGSGKSTIAHSLLGLLPTNARIASGAIKFEDLDLARMSSEKLWRSVRGRRIALVPQDPNIALNPVKKIGSQVGEALRLHTSLRGADARAEAVRLLDRVGLREPVRVLQSYPHELSGGMRQRVLVAIAICAKPDIIIADEPTSGLDVTVQKLVFDMLEELCASMSTSLLLITHDLAVAQERTDRILVLQRGSIVDELNSHADISSSRVSYTRALFEAAPSFHDHKLSASSEAASLGAERTDSGLDGKAIVTLDLVSKVYRRRVSRFTSEEFLAVDDISLSVRRGTTFGIVGESGSGKSTLMRLVAGLEPPTSGVVEVQRPSGAGRVQYVFQNPYSSLNPRMRVEDIVAEPLEVGTATGKGQRRVRAREMLELVGLDPTLGRRRPAELSGGQRQRVAIARALIADPVLIILDEPVSALDVSVQAQVLELLVDLKAALGLTYLFVTHDLAVVRLVCDEVAVVDGGRVVESGTATQILNHPQHSKTRELVSAIPQQHIAGRPTNKEES